MNTYRGYSYDMNADETWAWVDEDGFQHGDYPNSDACLDAIDARKKAQRLAQSA